MENDLRDLFRMNGVLSALAVIQMPSQPVAMLFVGWENLGEVLSP